MEQNNRKGDIMKNFKTILLKAAVYVIGFTVLMLSIFWLPLMANETAMVYPEFSYLKWPVLLGMYVTVIPFAYALFHALKLLKSIEQEIVFTKTALQSLKEIIYCASYIIVFYIIGIIFLSVQGAMHPGIGLMALVIMFASFIIALFAAVLRELLRKMVEIKTENDLTV